MFNANAMLYGMMAGQQVGQYHLESLLGAGGFGGVFRANEVVRDRVLRQVAVKVIPGNDEQQLEELLAAATLEHDQLIRCYTAGECRLLNIDALYLAMELAEGSLDSRLQPGPLESKEVRQVISEVAEGLAYLHSKKQVHRDLKPANVLRVKERWKLSDFGLVRRLGSESYAQTANPIGTIAYMPPEAFTGEISSAWDMWSLGIMVVQMVSQNLPYRFSEPTQLLKRVMDAELELPSLPEAFKPIVNGCLQVDRRKRWTAEQVLRALQGGGERRVNAPPPVSPDDVREDTRPRPSQPAVQVSPPQPAKQVVQPATPSPRGLITITENLGNGISLELIQLPAGQFMMGASPNDSKADDDEKPQHLVKLKAFAMGKYPITQAQYEAVMGKKRSKFQGNPNNPVECVSWNDAQAFCKKLSEATGKKYRLPSEAEWEYACRAGTTTRYYFGDDANQLGDYAWFTDNSRSKTHPVGQKRPNGWGLYDMHGNVWEWCEDSWHKNYKGAPTDGSAWIQGGNSFRILCGGGWYYSSRFCRSSFRDGYDPDDGYDDFGFRVVVSS
jgi:formylglycine-generating enzyme required for sulfatase activity